MKEFIKTYLIELCCSYTVISVVGAITNVIYGSETNNANVILMFVFCNIGVFVLSIHKLFDKLSPLAMIVIQYVVAFGLCLLVVFISSLLDEVSPRGWFEFIRSFTIVYVIAAGFYYYRLFRDAKDQQEMLKEIQDKAARNKFI